MHTFSSRPNALFFAPFALLTVACAQTSPPPIGLHPQASARQAVEAAELAFAKTMADRDFAAFQTFVAEDAIFLNGGEPLRGKAAIAQAWRPYYTGQPPYSWKPDLIEVLPAGNLAMTIGPVHSLDGKAIARFYSVWRLDTDGRWRVVFDNGYSTPPCVNEATKSP